MSTKHANQYHVLDNGLGEIVGYFRSDRALRAARAEWDDYRKGCAGEARARRCEQRVRYATPADVARVDPGDGPVVDYVVGSLLTSNTTDGRLLMQALHDREAAWLAAGALSVTVQRFIVDRWRRPGKSLDLLALGGVGSDVVFVLKVEAPSSA